MFFLTLMTHLEISINTIKITKHLIHQFETCAGHPPLDRAEHEPRTDAETPPPAQYGGICKQRNIWRVLVSDINNMGQPVYIQDSAEEMRPEMTKEEMQQLILIMGTITVISFILVITLSSIIIVFIWYVFTRI